MERRPRAAAKAVAAEAEVWESDVAAGAEHDEYPGELLRGLERRILALREADRETESEEGMNLPIDFSHTPVDMDEAKEMLRRAERGLSDARAEAERLREVQPELLRRLRAAEADRIAHERAAHEADLRTQAAVRAEKAAQARIAELEGVKADAERYRWLREQARQDVAYDVYGDGGRWHVSVFSADYRLSFDAAIDAARGKP